MVRPACAGTFGAVRAVSKSLRNEGLEYTMRAETQDVVDEIKQAVSLLRRHL